MNELASDTLSETLPEKEMLTLWLADKVLDTLEGEDELCLDALDTAKAELTDVNRQNQA